MNFQTISLAKVIRILIVTALSIIIFIFITGLNRDYEPLIGYVDQVDQDKFSGEWYIVSNIPYFAEKGKVASKAIYKRKGPNSFDDIFESKDGAFDKPIDRIVGKATSLNAENTKWRSTFYWLISFEFEVLYVDEDYTTMVLGHRSRDYGWVMSRTKTVSQDTINRAMSVFTKNGYDITKFELVPQTPDQLHNTNIQLFQGI